MNTRVMIVDDHKMFRDGLRVLINAEPGMEVVGEAVDGREAVDLARRISPDVVVMDISMPGMNGIEAMRYQATPAGQGDHAVHVFQRSVGEQRHGSRRLGVCPEGLRLR
jgi:DNA-binding NarL/FixJ family response regulator